MKYLLVFMVGLFAGCSPNTQPQLERNRIAPSIEKIKDGNNTCYIYAGYGISCVRETK